MFSMREKYVCVSELYRPSNDEENSLVTPFFAVVLSAADPVLNAWHNLAGKCLTSLGSVPS